MNSNTRIAAEHLARAVEEIRAARALLLDERGYDPAVTELFEALVRVDDVRESLSPSSVAIPAGVLSHAPTFRGHAPVQGNDGSSAPVVSSPSMTCPCNVDQTGGQ